MSFKQIITHSGAFHADDVFAAAVFKAFSPQAPITRTRDPEILSAATQDAEVVVFDVGDVYDPVLNNFDHHHRDFDQIRPDGLPYASIGLVWRTYGERYVRFALGTLSLTATNERVEQIAAHVDTKLILSMDAADCGQLSVRGRWRKDPEVSISVSSLSHMITHFHPLEQPSSQSFDQHFLAAVGFAQTVLRSCVKRAFDYYTASDMVALADDGSPILVLHNYLPWYDHISDHHRFVLSPAKSGQGWMVETVQDDFVQRCSLPLPWAGLRHEVLAQASGVEDAIFVHRAQFVGSAMSLGGARQMAQKALEFQALETS